MEAGQHQHPIRAVDMAVDVDVDVDVGGIGTVVQYSCNPAGGGGGGFSLRREGVSFLRYPPSFPPSLPSFFSPVVGNGMGTFPSSVKIQLLSSANQKAVWKLVGNGVGPTCSESEAQQH